MLVPNTPLKRMEYIAKQYGATAPEVVLDTFIIMSDTVGIESVAELPNEFVVGLGSANPFLLWTRVSISVEHERADDVRMTLFGIGPNEPLGSSVRLFRRASEKARYEHLTKEALLYAGMKAIRKIDNMRQGTETDAVWVWVATQLFKLRKESLKSQRVDVTGTASEAELRRAYKAALTNATRAAGKYNNAMALLRRKGPALALWQRKRNINLNDYDYRTALAELRKFADEEKVVEAGEVIYRWPDGWTIQRLDTDEQLKSEGEAMQNCVDTYCDDVKGGDIQILSLRDPKSRPHVSIEYLPQYKTAVQIRGKQNEPPVDKYWLRVDEFFEAAGIRDLESLSDAIHENSLVEGEWRPGFPKEDLTGFSDKLYATGQAMGESIYNEWITEGWRPSVVDVSSVDVEHILRELADGGQQDDVLLRLLGVPTRLLLDRYDGLAAPFIARMETGADDALRMLADRGEEEIEAAIQDAYERAAEEPTMAKAKSVVAEVLSLTNANEADYERAMDMVREYVDRRDYDFGDEEDEGYEEDDSW